MMHTTAEGIIAGLKFAATSATAGAIAAVSQPIEMLGIPVSVLLAAMAGALFGLAYSPAGLWQRFVINDAKTRTEYAAKIAASAVALGFTLCAIALASCWIAQTIPHVPGFGWSANVPPVAFSGLVAFTGQHVLPRALALAAAWLDARKVGGQNT